MNTRIPQTIIIFLFSVLFSISTGYTQTNPHDDFPHDHSQHHVIAPSNQFANYQAIPKKRSPKLAAALTLGTYLGGWALMYASDDSDNDSLFTLGFIGIMAAPSIGHIYAGEPLKGLGLSALSTIGAGMLVAGAISNICFDGDGSCGNSNGGLLLLGGLALHFGSTIYAAIDAPSAANRTNEKHRQFMLAPTMVGKNIGLGVAGTF